MGVLHWLFGGHQSQEQKTDLMLGDDKVKLQYQLKPSDPAVKFTARHEVTRDVYMQVKAMLRDMRDNKTYKNVRELSKAIGLGKSTVYRIKASRSWGAYKDDSK